MFSDFYLPNIEEIKFICMIYEHILNIKISNNHSLWQLHPETTLSIQPSKWHFLNSPSHNRCQHIISKIQKHLRNDLQVTMSTCNLTSNIVNILGLQTFSFSSSFPFPFPDNFPSLLTFLLFECQRKKYKQ